MTFKVNLDIILSVGFDWLIGMDMFETFKAIIDFERFTATFSDKLGNKTTVPLVKQQNMLSH